jgi:rod shape-determining protein MreC
VAATRHSNQRITLVMLLLVSVTVLTLDYHGEANRAIGHVRNGFAQVVSPFQRAAQAVLHPFGDVVSSAFHYGSLQTENAKLREANGALQRELYANEYAARVSQARAALNNLPFVGTLPTVPAQVTERSSSNFEATIELNQGWSSGVGVGMPVVGQGGLVGTVLSASASTSTVLILQDTRQALGVEDNVGHPFVLSGNGSGRPLLIKSGNAGSTALNKGVLLATSGQTNNNPAALYPAGIPVGVVATSTTGPGGIATGTVTPLVNIDTVEFVDVLEWLPSA